MQPRIVALRYSAGIIIAGVSDIGRIGDAPQPIIEAAAASVLSARSPADIEAPQSCARLADATLLASIGPCYLKPSHQLYIIYGGSRKLIAGRSLF